MRITFQMLSKSPLRNIASSLERLTELQTQAGSTKRFQVPSDDPLGVMKAMGFKTLMRHNEIYQGNTTNADMYLKMVDSTILSVKGLLDSAKDLALGQRSDTSTADTRSAAAIEVRGLLSDVRDLMNTKFHGKYLFSGHRTQTKPFVDLNGTTSYAGDDGIIQFRIGAERMIDVTVPGSRFLELGEEFRSTSVAMHPRVTNGTLLDSLNGGAGVMRGRFQITDGAGVTAVVDLAGANTVGDALARINNALPPQQLIAGLSPAGDAIVIQGLGGPGEITVTELDGGTAAANLGIAGTSTLQVLRGSALAPLLTENTLINSVDSIGGVLLGSIAVVANGESHIVNFQLPSYVQTVGDLLDRIEASVPGFQASINATGDGIELTSDLAFTISEVGAGTTAAALGLIGPADLYSPYGLFACLEDLQAALLSNDGIALDDAIGDIEAVIENLLEIEAEVGARGEQVEIVTNQLKDEMLHLDENLSMVEEVDMAEVLTKLAEAQVTYQAALQTASEIYELNLLAYMK